MSQQDDISLPLSACLPGPLRERLQRRRAALASDGSTVSSRGEVQQTVRNDIDSLVAEVDEALHRVTTLNGGCGAEEANFGDVKRLLSRLRHSISVAMREDLPAHCVKRFSKELQLLEQRYVTLAGASKSVDVRQIFGCVEPTPALAALKELREGQPAAGVEVECLARSSEVEEHNVSQTAAICDHPFARHVRWRDWAQDGVDREVLSLSGTSASHPLILLDKGSTDVYLCSVVPRAEFWRLKGCRIHIGAIAGSVYVSCCEDCSFSFSAVQLRIHDCRDCLFHVNMSARPVLENSKGIVFAHQNFHYEGISNDVASVRGLGGTSEGSSADLRASDFGCPSSSASDSDGRSSWTMMDDDDVVEVDVSGRINHR